MRTETWENPSIKTSLTTDPDKFSNDSWSLLLKSEEVAKQWKHLNLDVEHIIQVLFNDISYKKFINS